MALGAGGVVAASAASGAAEAASHSGMAGFVNHFTEWPVIGGLADSYVQGVAHEAGGEAAIGTLPMAIIVALGVFVTMFFLLKKNKVSFHKGSSLDSLANVVGGFIFLPMLAKYNEVISRNPTVAAFAYNSSIEKICEWGYKKEYAENLVSYYLNKVSASDLKQLFDGYLMKIKGLGKKDLYQGVCTKSEVPPSEIQKIAQKLADEVIPNTKKKS